MNFSSGNAFGGGHASLLLPKANTRQRIAATDGTRFLKQGIWAYFFLLIFEGALRKWMFPFMATPLLLIRDPLAIVLLIAAKKRGLFPWNAYVFLMGLIGMVGFYAAVFFGHGSLTVAFFGLRILLFHFPLMFLIGKVFTQEDVLKLGKATLLISIPMIVLFTLQFYSPQSAWVNRGVGGDTEGAGFSGAMGFFRPPGTFSFVTGAASFFSLAACFVFYFWFQPKNINRLVLLLATGSVLLSVPLSISRTMLFQVIVTFAFAVLASLRNPKYFGKMMMAGIGIIMVLVLLSNTPIFKTALEVFSVRADAASETEGGLKGTIADRFLGGMLTAIIKSPDQPFFGYGLGLGTNAGSALLSGGTRKFLIAEEEWGRVVGELGLLLGLAVIFLRISLAFKIAWKSYQKLRSGNLLPWMLLSYAFLLLLQGGWAQPTSLGFCTLVGGAILASLKSNQAS